ncbi:MAG: TIM44-like domain-containing protein [Planctomycetota bacterium]
MTQKSRIRNLAFDAWRVISRSPWSWMLLATILALTFVDVAWARLGGGESFSGRSSHDDGGGGGDNGFLIYLLIQLIFRYPIVGIPLAIAVIGFVIYTKSQQMEPYSSSPTTNGPQAVAANVTLDESVDELQQIDPNFSAILFSDFVYTLYGKVQEARGRGRLGDYAPYLAEGVRAMLAGLTPREAGLSEVRGVIVGSARLVKVSGLDQPSVTLAVRFETNYTEILAGNKGKPVEQTLYSVELWEFSRNRAVLSRPPEKTTVLDCPNCGSSLELTPQGACVHCGVKIDDGRFQWFVTRVRLKGRENRGPTLTEEMPERGTNLPTLFDPRFQATRKVFLESNPDFSWQRTEARYRHIFIELQNAWSSMAWDKARPYVSDSLFQFFSYWMGEYRRQRLRNALSDINIEGVIPCKLRMDAYYDAMTVRFFASMVDTVVDANGKLVRGSPGRPREFSEYWTFIRRRGTKESHADNTNCPNCGAALKINMAGVCEFCGSKLTSGEFDWVLSQIEQDEAYVG